MSDPQRPAPGGHDEGEQNLTLQQVPKVTRFRKPLVYSLIGATIIVAACIVTYGLMHSNHHDIVGAGNAHESTASTVPDVSAKYPKSYADVRGLAKSSATGDEGAKPQPAASNSASIQKGPSQPSEQQVARAAGVFFRLDPMSSQAPQPAPGLAAATTVSAPASADKIASPYGDQPLPTDAQGGLTVQKNAFLSSAATTKDYVSQALQHPRSRFEVKAGSLIPAALVTAINSDLPGEVIAQVTENVFDTVSGRYLLIPQGSRVIGKYDSLISYGQDRALVVWNRLILPNGNSIDLEAMRGTDETGAAGLQDETDHHRWAFAGALAVSTVMSFGPSVAQAFAQKATTGSNTNIYTQPSTTLGTQTSEIGENLLNRELNRPNTITIRQGWPLRILLNRDMVMEAYPNG